MAETNRKPMLDRLGSLLVAPFLLGRQALSLEWAQAEGKPPEPGTETPTRLAITSPEHAIKRRG
jgi:hypothetical protein